MVYFNTIYSDFFYLKERLTDRLVQLLPSRKRVEKGWEIGKEAIYGSAVYALGISPLYLSRMKKMNIFAISGFAGLGCYFFFNLGRLSWSWVEIIMGGLFTVAGGAGVADFFGFIPQNKTTSLALDSLFISTTLLGSLHLLVVGIPHLFFPMTLTQFAWNGIAVTLGIRELKRCFSTGRDILAGLPAFNQLGQEQKELVLRYKAIEHLGKKKKYNAVILDGMLRDKENVDRHFQVFGNIIYEKFGSQK